MRRDIQNSSSNEETFYTGESTPHKSSAANIEYIEANAVVNEYVQRAKYFPYQIHFERFDKFAIDRHSIIFQQ